MTSFVSIVLSLSLGVPFHRAWQGLIGGPVMAVLGWYLLENGDSRAEECIGLALLLMLLASGFFGLLDLLL